MHDLREAQWRGKGHGVRAVRAARVSWVLEAIEYRDVADMRASLERIIAPAEAKASELRSAT